MSGRGDDTARVCEIYAVVVQTLRQVVESGVTASSFMEPRTAVEELVADGLIARVLRVTEEAGNLSEDLEKYGIPVGACRGMRNIIAHTYWRVDRAVVWQALAEDFPAVRDACERYARDKGFDLSDDA